MRLAGACAALLVGACAHGAADNPRRLPLPPGWEAPALQELAATPDYGARLRHRERYLRAFGDFDGDGRRDAARVLRSRDHRHSGVFITRNTAEGPRHERIIEDAVESLPSLGVQTVAPGRYPTACARNLGPAGGCERPYVELTREGVGYFTFEAGAVYLWWTGREFRGDYVSD